MASLTDLNWWHRRFMQRYRYRSFDWSPGHRLKVPLKEARVAVVTTAGFHLPGQPRFDPAFKGGDVSFRVIPADADLAHLQIGHKSSAFDHSGIESDPNLALPLDRLEELTSSHIGSVAPRHFSFMGSITAPGRLMVRSAPEVAGILLSDQVDVVLLTPV